MSVEIRILPPVPADARPYKATVVTRDAGGKLVGVRVVRAHREQELDSKLAQFRGVNARDDIANQPKGI